MGRFMIDISSIENFRVFIKYYRVFPKMIQNKKSNAKLTHDFLELSFVLFT